MKLGILERILLVSLLPEKADFKLVKAISELREAIRFTEEESRKYDIHQNPLVIDDKVPLAPDDPRGRMVEIAFNSEVAKGYEVEIRVPPLIASYASKKLQEMSAANLLDERFITLYEKLVI